MEMAKASSASVINLDSDSDSDDEPFRKAEIHPAPTIQHTPFVIEDDDGDHGTGAYGPVQTWEGLLDNLTEPNHGGYSEDGSADQDEDDYEDAQEYIQTYTPNQVHRNHALPRTTMFNAPSEAKLAGTGDNLAQQATTARQPPILKIENHFHTGLRPRTRPRHLPLPQASPQRPRSLQIGQPNSAIGLHTETPALTIRGDIQASSAVQRQTELENRIEGSGTHDLTLFGTHLLDPAFDLDDDENDPELLQDIFADQSVFHLGWESPERKNPDATSDQIGEIQNGNPVVIFDDILPLVLEVLPDVCPDHVRERFVEYRKHLSNVTAGTLLADILNDERYPRRQTGNKRPRDDKDSDEELLKSQCPPSQYSVASKTLQKQFPYMRASAITAVLKNTPSIYEAIVNLKKIEQNSGNPVKQGHEPLRKRRRAGVINIDDIADPILRSLFRAAQKKISEDEEAERTRKLKVEEDEMATKRAFETNDISQCQCCYDDYPNAKIVICSGEESHPFCIECLGGHVKAQLDLQQHEICCMDSSGCKAKFSRSSKEKALDDKTFERLERVQQQNELQAAGLPLSHCPFCDYAAICPPVEEDRELRCQGPRCGIISCRLCKQTSHIPLTCEEYKKEQGVDERHLIEEEMTKAFLRKCPKCNVPIVKDGGCNKITCSRCHACICDVCGKDITKEGYRHFGTRCPQVDEAPSIQRAAQRVSEAEKAATRQVLAEHPDLSAEDLEIKLSETIKPQDATPAGQADRAAWVEVQARQMRLQLQQKAQRLAGTMRARRPVDQPPLNPYANDAGRTIAGNMFTGYPFPAPPPYAALPPVTGVHHWNQAGYHNCQAWRHNHSHYNQHPLIYYGAELPQPSGKHTNATPFTHGAGRTQPQIRQPNTVLPQMPDQQQGFNFQLAPCPTHEMVNDMNTGQATAYNLIQQQHNAVVMDAMQQNQALLQRQREALTRRQETMRYVREQQARRQAERQRVTTRVQQEENGEGIGDERDRLLVQGQTRREERDRDLGEFRRDLARLQASMRARLGLPETEARQGQQQQVEQRQF